MNHDPLFDTVENQALLVICARKTIRYVGIAGIIWGTINTGLGAAAIFVSWLNVSLLLLGLLMLGTGIFALTRPSLAALLLEAIVSGLLFCWNVAVTVLNVTTGHSAHVNPRGLIFPAITAFLFFREYYKLGHLKEAVSTLDAQTIQQATAVWKELFKKKVKEERQIAEAASKKCRIQFMSDSVFCAQRNLRRAFHMGLADFRKSITDLNRKKLTMIVNHPVGKLTYAFDKTNSEKIKGWLSASLRPESPRAPIADYAEPEAVEAETQIVRCREVDVEFSAADTVAVKDD